MNRFEKPTFAYEQKAHAEGFLTVAGVDEAGRGPLCGPVVAAAVILPPDLPDLGINDSKKLSEKKREALFDAICQNALSFGVGQASPEEIDRLNILGATMLAMNRAADSLSLRPDLLLIDGNCSRSIRYPAQTLVKGDSKSLSIAAASILAKVTRDRILYDLAEIYPQYHLEKHKGYPTAEHIALLRRFGPCEIYRKSFLRKICP